MAEIEVSTTVTLTALEIAEAIRDYVGKMQGGDLPVMDVSSAVIYPSDGNAFALSKTSKATAVICTKQ
jgi:hypothetical protein